MSRRRRLLLVSLILAPAMAGVALTAWPMIAEQLHRDPYQPVDLKALGGFAFNDQAGIEQDIPDEFRKLNGKKVSLMGMMWAPASVGANVAEFQLVYHVDFSGFHVPQPQERVFVHWSGRRIQWFDQLVRLRGTLHVQLLRNETGTVYSVYTLTDPIVDLPPPSRSPSADLSNACAWGMVVSAVECFLIFVPQLLELATRLSRRERRRRAGLCVRCGYDLRASPLRCPECGAPNATTHWYELR